MNSRRFVIWFHMIVGLAVGAYFYSPLKDVPQSITLYQYVLLPAAALSGLYLWKGHKLRQWLKR